MTIEDQIKNMTEEEKEKLAMRALIEKINREEYFGALYNVQEDFEKRLLSERAEGIEQGSLQVNREIAKRMKKDNIDIESIIKYTSLSKEEIERL